MNKKSLLVFTLLTTILASTIAVSFANAAPDEVVAPPQIGEDAIAPADVPNLIATQDDTVTSEEPPLLIQTRDNSTAARDESQTDGSQVYTTQEDGGDPPNLISPLAAPDNTMLIVGTVLALALVIVVVAVVLVSRRRNAES